MNEPIIDETIFQKEYDIHKRGKSCLMHIRHIQANTKLGKTKKGQLAHILKRTTTLSPYNRLVLLNYAKDMSENIKINELSLASFEKNLSEAWIIGLIWNKDLSEKEFTLKNLEEWWEQPVQDYRNNKISWETLSKKRNVAMHFFKWLLKLKRLKRVPHFDEIELPKKEKDKTKTKHPTSEQIKTLLKSVEIAGKKMTIRDTAVLSVCYDTGCRIGEVLSVKENDLWEEENYYVIHFPESKTCPRTVITYLSKPFIKAWLENRPNGYNPEGTGYLFCRFDGQPCSYAVITDSFKRALRKSGIAWKKGKGVHFFRALWSSRAIEWGYTLKHAWLGWSFKDHEKAYSQVDYTQFKKSYFEMLKEERNALLPPQDLGIVENKESVYIDKTEQKKMIENMLEGRFEAIENKMLNLLLEKRKVS